MDEKEYLSIIEYQKEYIDLLKTLLNKSNDQCSAFMALIEWKDKKLFERKELK